MLDRLLVRADRHALWAGNDADTLRYVVLDEFHTYDGAQGTDVAMLLRRLGATLGWPRRTARSAAPRRSARRPPSGRARRRRASCGSSLNGYSGWPSTMSRSSRRCARQLTRLAAQSITRFRSPPVSDINEINEMDHDAFDLLAAVFTGKAEPATPEHLGDVLQRHHLTRAILTASGEASRSWDDVRSAVVGRTPQWGIDDQHHPELVDIALARYVALLSIARRSKGAGLSFRSRCSSGSRRFRGFCSVDVDLQFRGLVPAG